MSDLAAPSSAGIAATTSASTDVVGRACPQCDLDAPRDLPRYERDGWRIAECSQCRFVYMPRVPSPDRLSDELAWEKQHAKETKRRRKVSPLMSRLDEKTRWRLKLFKTSDATLFRRLFPHGRVLDVGCGGGNRIPEPFTPYGIEISSALAARSKAQKQARGGDVVEASAVDGIRRFEAGSFSGVVLRSFLEHEAEPQKVLDGTAQVLAPSGCVYVKVPNFGSVNRRVMGRKWCGIRLPDHVNYFTPSSLRQMVERAGFKIGLLNRWNLPLDDDIHAVLRFASADER